MPSNIARLNPSGHFAVSFTVEKKSIHEDENDDGLFGIFRGYASTFGNVDKHLDIVTRGAFTKTIDMRDKVKMLWQHAMEHLIGSFIEFKEDDFGLFVTGRVNLGTQHGKDAFALIKAGDLNTMSIGYKVNDFSIDRETGVRILKELHIVEISLVTMPANDLAQITSIKSFIASELLPIMTADELKSEIPEMKADDTAKNVLKKIALYENEGEYKLFIGARLEDGSIKAHPEWIKKAVKELKELDISDQEKALIRVTLAKYYKEIDEDCPWEAKSIDKLETITDVDEYLQDKGMSNKEVKKIISKIKEFSRERDAVDKKAEPKERDAVDSKAIVTELNNIIKSIKGDK